MMVRFHITQQSHFLLLLCFCCGRRCRRRRRRRRPQPPRRLSSRRLRSASSSGSRRPAACRTLAAWHRLRRWSRRPRRTAPSPGRQRALPCRARPCTGRPRPPSPSPPIILPRPCTVSRSSRIPTRRRRPLVLTRPPRCLLASTVRTYGLRGPASCVLYVPEAQGSLPRGSTCCPNSVHVPVHEPVSGVPYMPCIVAPDRQTG